MDECDDVECEDGAACNNLPGSYECVCAPGYRYHVDTCFDVNECLLGLDDCAEAAQCDNTAGSFECECLAGFEGDGRDCDDVDECATDADDCRGEAQCRNLPGGYACDCPEGRIPHAQGCIDPEVCVAPTDWAQVAPSLADYADLLPAIPEAPLAVEWDEPGMFREDFLVPERLAEPWPTTPERCDGPTPWPADRLQVGPVALSQPFPPGRPGGEPY